MVKDILATTRALQQRGIVFEQPPQPLRPGSSLSISYFHTPHGICVELWGMNQPDISSYLSMPSIGNRDGNEEDLYPNADAGVPDVVDDENKGDEYDDEEGESDQDNVEEEHDSADDEEDVDDDIFEEEDDEDAIVFDPDEEEDDEYDLLDRSTAPKTHLRIIVSPKIPGISTVSNASHPDNADAIHNIHSLEYIDLDAA
jgi:hypothetical protein